MRTIGLLVIALGVGVPAQAWAKRERSNRVVPPKKTRAERIAAREAKDWSEGGTRRGAIEYTLGGVTAALFVVLIGRGAWEVVQGRELERRCADGTASDLQCTFAEPARGNWVAAGLSFGFAVPMAIASGFLFAHANRINRDYRSWRLEQQRVTLLPSPSRRGMGLGLQVRF